MATVEDYHAEFAAALAVMRPQGEGFDDMNHLVLVHATDHVRASIADDERRKQLIVAADEKLAQFEQALAALHADGYPVLKKRVIPTTALAELLHQRTTYDAALERFTTAEEAAHVIITAGAPEDIPT